jgi:hypothetical protein
MNSMGCLPYLRVIEFFSIHLVTRHLTIWINLSAMTAHSDTLYAVTQLLCYADNISWEQVAGPMGRARSSPLAVKLNNDTHIKQASSRPLDRWELDVGVNISTCCH